MRLEDEQESENVEDERGMPRGAMMAGGGVGTLVIVLIVWLLGGDPRQLLQQQQQQQQQQPQQQQNPFAPRAEERANPPREDEQKKFVAKVLKSTEEVWGDIFQRMGKTYRQPKLVLFTGQVQSTCGFASAAVGPFYCPGDEKVYIDLAFYRQLKEQLGAPGEFAQAYVVAHEVGHHVQKLLGTSDLIQAKRQRASEVESNRLSVQLELQADFYAGVWAHHAQEMKHILDPGDIEAGLRAASAIGDDRLQKQARGYVVPDSFTHGTSAQRVRWFRKGFDTGDINQGDTFHAKDL